MSEWCPTRAGEYTAYLPEYFEDDKWRPVPTETNPNGIPQPMFGGGINAELGLFGHAQAMTLAWGHAAQYAAHGRKIKIRVQPYQVIYDLKAKKRPEGYEE